MKYTIVITTKDRPEVLRETLHSIDKQTVSPTCVVIVADKPSDFLPFESDYFSIRIIYSSQSSATKRNLGVRACRSEFDIILFLDDDVELHRHYAEKALAFFARNGDVVAASGTVLLDRWTPRDDARALLNEAVIGEASFRGAGPHWILYGCNMIIRRNDFEAEWFDQELPAYSYGEDYELSIRLSRRGKVGRISNCLLVHLRAPQGRMDRDRYAYSIIANNWYFLRKGSVHLGFPKSYIRFFWIVVRLGYRESNFAKAQIELGGTSGVKGVRRALGDFLTGRLHPSRLNRGLPAATVESNSAAA